MTPASLFAAAAAVLVSSASAGAVELPARKAGLWEIRIKMTGGVMPTARMHHCTDAGTDWRMSTLFNPMAQDPCPQFDVQKIEDTTPSIRYVAPGAGPSPSIRKSPAISASTIVW